jgi:hypothetical protein
MAARRQIAHARALAKRIRGAFDRLGTRKCIDHVIVFGETHARRLMSMYASYYNEARTHLSLGKDAPICRLVERFGHIVAQPMVAGLHHRYARI